MSRDLAGDSVVEEGSVNGFLELEDEMSGSLLLLQMRFQGACCCCWLCQTPAAVSCDWENHDHILLLSRKLWGRFYLLTQCWDCPIPSYFSATKQEYDIASHQPTSGMGTLQEGEVWSQSIPWIRRGVEILGHGCWMNTGSFTSSVPIQVPPLVVSQLPKILKVAFSSL